MKICITIYNIHWQNIKFLGFYKCVGGVKVCFISIFHWYYNGHTFNRNFVSTYILIFLNQRMVRFVIPLFSHLLFSIMSFYYTFSPITVVYFKKWECTVYVQNVKNFKEQDICFSYVV